MQIITWGEVVERKTPVDTEGEQERVEDPTEIAAMIRRVVTMSWRDAVFTYDELADHLTMNGAVLSEDVRERDEYFEQVIMDIWHTRKELARAAGEALPSLVRAKKDGSNMVGIAVPGNAVEAAVPVETEVAEVIVLPQDAESEAEPVVNEHMRMARLTMGVFLNEAGHKGRSVKRSDLVELLGGQDQIDYKVLRQMLEELMDNGYVEARRLGDRRDAPIWYRMPDGVMEAITEAADDQGVTAAEHMSEMIDYIFRNRVDEEVV